MISRKTAARFWISTILLIFSFIISAVLLVKNLHTTDGRTPYNTTGNIPTNLKVYVDQYGLFHIDRKTLESYGLLLGPVERNRYRLSLRGETQRLWVTETEDYELLFYGRPSDSVYVNTNIYLLSIESSPIDETTILSDTVGFGVNDYGLAAKDTYTSLNKLEKNQLYYPQISEGDHWFWGVIPANQEQSYEITLSDVDEGIGTVHIRLWGNTQSNENPDHHILATINGTVVVDQFWDGIGWRDITAVIPAGILSSGKNDLRLRTPGDTGAPAEINLFDWVEIEYPRKALVQDGSLVFDGTDRPILLGGFNGRGMILDITNPEVPSVVELFYAGKDGVIFQTGLGRRYLALMENAWLEPYQIVPSNSKCAQFADSVDMGADYLIIGSKDLTENLVPLIKLRQSQGLKVEVITPDVIYDHFNYGYAEPIAIQRFLQYTSTQWNPTPRYVLLVGDSTYDPWGYISKPPSNILPSFFVETKYGGQTVSDVPYELMNDDNIPDLSVGRLPASSSRQVQTWVEKVIKFERTLEEGNWASKVLAIADEQDPSFQRDAEDFISGFPPPFVADMISQTTPDDDASGYVMSAFNNGYYLVAYFGHGSLTMWGKDRLFSLDNASTMTNPLTPIVLQLTCLTGLFTHPESYSLTEALIFQPNGGAVASLAPTSLTLPVDQHHLVEPLVQALTDSETRRLGDALLFAQRSASSNGKDQQDVLLTFLLFGDPALMIR